MKASDIVEALRKRHSKSEWAFFPELRVGTGYSSRELRKAGINPEQRLDGYAINLYPSKKHLRIAYEIKVSRSDFLGELKKPEKRQQALRLSNEFYFVAPKGLIKPEELPEECGLIEVDDDLNTRVKVKAPYRETDAPTWNFLAAIARRVQRTETSPEAITQALSLEKEFWERYRDWEKFTENRHYRSRWEVIGKWAIGKLPQMFRWLREGKH